MNSLSPNPLSPNPLSPFREIINRNGENERKERRSIPRGEEREPLNRGEETHRAASGPLKNRASLSNQRESISRNEEAERREIGASTIGSRVLTAETERLLSTQERVQNLFKCFEDAPMALLGIGSFMLGFAAVATGHLVIGGSALACSIFFLVISRGRAVDA